MCVHLFMPKNKLNIHYLTDAFKLREITHMLKITITEHDTEMFKHTFSVMLTKKN